jgi:hypothetical protein
MPLRVCKPDAWYLVIRCKQCRVRQPMHLDYSEGESELLRNYWTRCDMCAHIDIYEPAEIERYHHIVKG